MKKLILIILFTISLNAQSSDLLLLFGDGLTTPSFASSTGVIQRGTTTVNVNLPAVVDENDILIVQVNLTNFGVAIRPTFSLPANWTMGDSLSGLEGGTSGIYTNWIWKRADGSEDGGTVTITGSDLTDCKGTSLRFAECEVTGTPYEVETNRGSLSLSATITSQEITTLGSSRLAVCLVNVFDDNTLSVQMSNYTKQQEVTTSSGIFDAQLILETQEIPSAGVVAVDSATNSASDAHCTFTFALIPVGG